MSANGSVAAVVAICVVAFPARALVGPAAEDAAFAPYTLMVLRSAQGRAGFCTGVVVSREAVLTAAHCVARIEDTRIHFKDAAGKPVLKSVAAIAVHPLYRANAAKTRERSIDLALVRVAEALPERFLPAPLDSGATISVGARFRIAGFGVAREGRGDTSGVLRSGRLAARAPLSSILLWAEDPQQTGLGACEGDSGGPIFAEASNTLVAITNWAAGAAGKGCGNLTQAALIAPQRAWLDGVLRGWGAK